MTGSTRAILRALRPSHDLDSYGIRYYLPHVLENAIDSWNYIFHKLPETNEIKFEPKKWMWAFGISSFGLLLGGRVLYFKKSNSRKDAEKACKGLSKLG